MIIEKGAGEAVGRVKGGKRGGLTKSESSEFYELLRACLRGRTRMYGQCNGGGMECGHSRSNLHFKDS